MYSAQTEVDLGAMGGVGTPGLGSADGLEPSSLSYAALLWCTGLCGIPGRARPVDAHNTQLEHFPACR
jgi:hypothetical protein